MASEALPIPDHEDQPPRRVKEILPISFSLFGAFGQLKELAQYWDLICTMSQHRVRVRYKQSMLGIAWAILQPLSLMLIYTVIFSYVAKIPSNGQPYAIFVFVGLLPWTYFSTTLNAATNSLVSHINLVTKVYFPREILPLTYVLAAFFDFLIALLIMACMMVYYHTSVTANLLWTIPIIVLMTLFVTAMALISSAAQVRFRDVGVGIPLLLQIWMYATPVVYPLSTIAKLSKPLRVIYMLNPMVGIIENFRRTVLQGIGPDMTSLVLSCAVSLILLPGAYIYFKHAEASAVDII